uniref:Uncharacterized protein n=1 Tax=Anopheles funestus TaxID=62324 RepID=A0A182S0S3_ANOFN
MAKGKNNHKKRKRKKHNIYVELLHYNISIHTYRVFSECSSFFYLISYTYDRFEAVR